MHVSKISFLIIMARQMIGDLKRQTSESLVFPVFVSFLQATAQKGQEEGNCDLSMDYIYHSNSLPV